MGFLSGFSDRFMIALGVWPFASFVLTLPILAILYNRNGRLKFGSVIGAYLSVLYGLGLVFFTLWPLPSGESGLGITYGVEPQFNPFAFIGDIAKDGLSAVFQILANIAFFIPLGFIFKRGIRMELPLAMLLSFLTSLLIETAQLTGLFGIYPFAYRTFDVSDLVWNTAGACAGWFIADALGRILPQEDEDLSKVNRCPGLLQRVVAFMLDMSLIGFAALFSAAVLPFFFYLTGIGGIRAADFGSVVGIAVLVVSFIVVEMVIPWFNAGQTPGGMFVRMSIESRERTLPRRALFYTLRLVIIVACFMLWPIPSALAAIPLIMVYYMLNREMPYDAI